MFIWPMHFKMLVITIFIECSLFKKNINESSENKTSDLLSSEKQMF